MSKLLAIVLAAAAAGGFSTARGSAQEARASRVVDTAEGPAEFVGLRKQTPEELLRRLEEHDAPKQPHLCAATLKQLGLADAAVLWARGADGKPGFVVLAVEDDARVRYRREPAEDGRELPPAWTALLEATADMGAFQFALLLYAERRANPEATDQAVLASGRTRFGMELPEKEIVAGWKALAALASPADHELALWTLAHDRDPRRRCAAACALLNFAADDRTWHALVDGERDPHDSVTSACGQVLQTLAKSAPRRVDWAPATESLRALLDGTNPFAFLHAAKALVATEIAPELAAQVVPPGGGLLLDAAFARGESPRAAALALLRLLAGRPDASAEDLERWAGALHAK